MGSASPTLLFIFTAIGLLLPLLVLQLNNNIMKYLKPVSNNSWTFFYQIPSCFHKGHLIFLA